jgi:hypothetical protein
MIKLESLVTVTDLAEMVNVFATKGMPEMIVVY